MLGVPTEMLEEAQAAGFEEEDQPKEHYDDGNGEGEVLQEQDFVPAYGGGEGVDLANNAFSDAED